MKKSKLRLIVAAIAALFAELFAPAFSGIAQAAPPQFAHAFVRLDTHKENTPTGALVCVVTSAAATAATERYVTVTFPTSTAAPNDFTLNQTASNWVVDNVDLPSNAEALSPATTVSFWPGMTSGVTSASTVSGHTVTFDLGSGGAGNLSANNQYCFHITGTNTLTTGSAASATQMTGSTIYTETTTPEIVEQTNWATSVVTDNSVTVSAIVPPNFTLTMPVHTDTFGTLNTTQVNSTSGVTVTFETNAVGGWIAWAKDQYQGLYSATAAYTIDSGLKNAYPTQTQAVGDPAFDLVASSGGVGREGYVMDVDLTTDAASGCTVDIDNAFDSASGAGGGFLSNSSYRQIASCSRPGSPPGTSDGDVITLVERAVIRGGTPAGSDYSDVITVVGAGNF